MSKILYPDYSVADREKMLSNTATKTELVKYFRTLSHEDIEKERRLYLDNDTEIASKEAELETLAAKVKGIKEVIKNLEAQKPERLAVCNTGMKEISGRLWGFADHASGKMYFYDSYGELIESRTRNLTQDEKQGKIPFADAAQVAAEAAAMGSDVVVNEELPAALVGEAVTDAEFEETGGEGQALTGEAETFTDTDDGLMFPNLDEVDPPAETEDEEEEEEDEDEAGEGEQEEEGEDYNPFK
jgi:hypothetical protein